MHYSAEGADARERDAQPLHFRANGGVGHRAAPGRSGRMGGTPKLPSYGAARTIDSVPSLEVVEPMPAPAEQAWRALTDWERQGDWMLLTRVRVVGPQRRGVGDRLEAFTGIGPVGFTDTMVVTYWVEGRSVTVAHTGRVVRGSGEFRVEDAGPGRSRLVWRADLDVPGGWVGRLGWWVIEPVNRWAVRRSLRRLAGVLAGSGQRRDIA